jgi:hypothetical protein
MALVKQQLEIFVTVDVGPADATLGHGHKAGGDWARTEQGVGIVRDVLKSLGDRYEKPVPATWFLRADRLIARQFRDPVHVIRMFSPIAGILERDRHEIGWMPQIYEAGRLEVLYDDLPWIYEQIKAAGLTPKSMRMGDCFHDNRTMRIVSELGICVDSSAVPGRQKSDGGWRMNWIGTPQSPYYPSIEDYRTPGFRRLDVLEVPLSVSPLMAPYDSAPLLRYINPCMRKEYFSEAIGSLLPSASNLVMVLHPDEVVPRPPGGGHPLVAYSAGELTGNLSNLIQSAILLKRPMSFHTLQEFVSE